MGTPNLNLTGGGRLRPQAEGTDPQGALRSLLGLKSISNVGGLSNRGLDVATGVDAFEPAEAELMQAQQMPGLEGFSREQLREQAMSKIKNVLGMNQIQHGQRMELEGQKAQTAMDRYMMGQEQINARQNAGRDAQMQMLDHRLQAQELGREDSQRNQKELQDARLAAQGNSHQVTIPAQMETSLGKSRDAYGSTMNRVMRGLPGGMFDGGRQGYEGALASVLTRMGSLQGLQQEVARGKASGMTGAALIAEAAGQGVQLHPYEQEYIKLVLGE